MHESAAVTLSFVSVFADRLELADYYQAVFDLAEVESLRSPHFRGLYLGDTVLGFSAAATAYELLELPRPLGADSGVRSFVTFEVSEEPLVQVRLERALAGGGTQVQAPHRTYYGAWQAVVLDPEGNAFRINHLPEMHG
ncbi:VOC family protein [uncultured Jatrophihabitans sp.]|uniref:VOC family protein n=1 Tax=uncultured Jatrophihabitans sp. TaxID=1610747 RepID=UPI0035CA9483